MSDMKRVQLILEEWQQTWLAEESKRQSISMSALLRQMMTEAIELRRAGSLADDPLWGAIGLGFGPRDGVTSENLDTFLYGIAANTRSAYPLRMAAESPAEFVTETSPEPSPEGESHVSSDR